MPFETIEVLAQSGRRGMPVSVSLSCIAGARPKCLVSIQRDFATEFRIKDGQHFELQIGTGDDVGLMRFKRNDRGALVARPLKAGGFRFDCGYIERFGNRPAEREHCNAEIIDADTIQIVLPEWSREDHAAPAAQKIDPTIRPKVSNDHILYGPKSKEVARRVAILLAPLAEYFGRPVKKSDLIKLVYGKEGANDPTYYALINSANAQIDSIGLVIRKVRNNGTAGAMLVATGQAA